MNKIYAKVLRGKKSATLLTPHKYKKGYYLVPKHGNTLDCRHKVYQYSELNQWIEKGYSIRMSGEGISPSLYSKKVLIINY